MDRGLVMSIRKRSHIAIIVVLVIIGTSLIPMVSAGSTVVTPATGKLIVTPWTAPGYYTWGYLTVPW